MTSNTPPIYFLLHVPKTAGQTIQRHLAAHCPPGWFWQPPENCRNPLRAGLDLSKVRAIAGHFVEASLERHFAGRTIRRVVLLRDPVAQQVSLYNFRMMNYLAKGLGTYSFALHQRALPRNFMTHKLLGDWLGISWPSLMVMSDARKYEIVNRTLSDFWFVAGHTECDRLIAAIAPDLHVPAKAPPRNTSSEWQRQVDWKPLRAESLSAAEIAAIRDRHSIDQAVWESWGEAGFDIKSVIPRPIAAAGSGPFLADELVRPAFLTARFLKRARPGLRRRAASAAGDAAREAGDWALAVQHYGAAVAEMPGAPALWMRYGYVLAQMGALAEAEYAYRNAISLEPARPYNRQQLGHILMQQGRASEAAELLGRAEAPIEAEADAPLARSKASRLG